MEYKSVFNQVENSISRYYQDTEGDILKNRPDLKNFLKFLNSKLKIYPQSPDLVLDDNTVSSDDLQKAQKLMKYILKCLFYNRCYQMYQL